MWKECRNTILSCLLLSASLGATSQNVPSPEGIAYISAYRETAVREMIRTGVPASIKLAQGILETGSGKSPLALRSNNHFGLKCKTSWTGERVYHDDDHNGECFRKYMTVEESYRDHSDYLRAQSWYAFLFAIPTTDYKAWAQGLKKAGYATNPRYAEMLIQCIETYRLDEITRDVIAGRLGNGKDAANSDTSMRRSVPPVMDASGKPSPAAATQTLPEARSYPSEPVHAVSRTQSGSRHFREKTVFVAKGTSLLFVAEVHGLPLAKLLEWNGITTRDDILEQDQLIYLRKPARFPSK